MGLRLKPTRKLGEKIATLIAVFALVVQPMYGLVANHVANATEQPASIPDAEIHSVRFTAVNHGYKGISVDQRLRGYTDVSSYKATLHRADGSSVSRVGKQPVLDIINKGGNQALTVPFDFAGSPEGAYWSSLSADWTHSTKPTGLTIELQSTSLGPVKFSTPDSQSLVESNHTYLSLLAQRPVVNVADGTPIRLKSSQQIQILASDNQGLRRVVGNVRDSSWGLAKSTQSNANGAHTHTHNVSLSGLTDGEYTLVYNARDTDEILSETKNFRFTIDNTGPEIQQLTPENNAIVGGKLSMEFEVTDPSDIRQVNIHLFQGGVSKLVVPLADMGNDVWGVSDYDITELDNGSYTFISRAVDGLGNLRAGTGTTHGTIILDKSAPDVSIESLNINITPKVSKSGVLSATIKADDNLAIKQIDANIYNKQLNKIEQGIGNLAEYALPEKKRDATVEISNQHLSSLTDGEYVLKVAVHDYSGKVAYAYKTFTIDTTAPTVQVTKVTPIHSGNIVGSNVKVSFRIDDASEISLDRTYVMFADGPGTTKQHKESSKIYLKNLEQSADGVYVATFDTKKFVAENYTGRYNLQFTLVDIHGNNTSTKPIEYRNILIDNSGPGSALSTPASGSYVQGEKAELTFTLSDDTGVSSVRVRLTNTVTGFEKWYNVTDFSDTEGSLTFDTTELPEGEYTITIRPVDSFGQPRYGANKGTVIVDRTAPTITRWIVGGKNYASPYTLTDEQLFNSKNINVQFKDNSKLAKVVINDHEIVGKWSNQKSFDAQWYMNQYAKEGSNIIALYDEAGNEMTYAFVIDSTAPKVEKITISHINEFGTSSETFGGDVKVTLKLTDPAGINLGGTWVRLGVVNGPSTDNVKLTATENPDEYAAIIDTDTADFAKKSYLDKVHVYIRTIDTLGNKGGAYSYKMNIPDQDNFYINIDNIKPDLSASLSDDLELSIEANGTNSNISKVQYRILDADKNNIKSIGWVDVPVVGEGPFVIDIDTSMLADGTNYVVRVRAFDEAGNKGHASDIELAYNIATPPIDEGADEEAARRAEQDRLAREQQAERDRIAQEAAARAEQDRPARERAEERVLPITPLATAFGNTALLPGDTVIDDATVETEDTDDGEVAAATSDTREDGDVLAAEDSRESWSLINLILAIAVAGASLLSILGLSGLKKEDRNVGARLLTLIPVAGASAVLYFIEDFSGSMNWVNIWSLLMVALLVVQMILVANARTEKE